MNLVLRGRTAILGAVLLAGLTLTELANAQESIDFGRQIQPIFAKRCFACHGPDKAEGGLRLNRRATATAKVDSGKQAIVPNESAQSELIHRISSGEEGERMPPEGAPLTPIQIELLKKWIDQGAVWKDHWAFEPLQDHLPPKVKNETWIANPIDSFILSQLEQNGLSPAAPLGKEALLRRVTYDLIGLPPTAAEVQAFLADSSPRAYESVVDRLLGSHHFGEHWARHWLDVVRYADTNSFERDGPKPNAWRYRDYVIRSFNLDKPYDQFIREQLAGDELPETGSDGVIATGFYRLGMWDDEPADKLLAVFDVLDDIITTTSQGFLGLTVNCARCHDHKIDPIPQQDYYSMLAFFQGITPNGNPSPNTERPIFENDAARQTYDAAVKKHQDRLNQLQASISTIENEFREKLRERQTLADQPDLDDLEYRFYRDTWQSLPDFDSIKPETVARLEKGFFDITPATREFAFGFVFTGVLKVPQDGEYTFSLDSDDGSRLIVDGQSAVVYDGIHGLGSPRTGKIRLKQGRVPIRLDYFQGPTGAKALVVKWSGPGVESRSLSAGAENGQLTSVKNRPDFAALMAAQGPTILGGERHDQYAKLTKELGEAKRHRVEAAYALCVTEVGPNPPETMLLKRGNPQSPGEKVVPAFITSLGGGTAIIPEPGPAATSSGRRLALANWIASSDNRLTARVMVNRIWQHLFGRGIVRSPNNFGLLGDRPTHPELLDWLALQLSTGGHAVPVSAKSGGAIASNNTAIGNVPWSMKRIHKLIVMSNAYRMSSQASMPVAAFSKNGMAVTDPRVVDPLNNLFWRHDMRRLSAEEIRDSILAVDGRLNPKMYGPGVFPAISDEVKAGQSEPGKGWETSSPEEQARRSIYVQVKRSLLLPILSDFDFADTDSSCAARFTTTQPTQALGMLNGAFLNQEAAEFARRLRTEAGDDVQKQVAIAYRLTLGREPDPSIIEEGLKLIESLKSKHNLTAEKALDQFCLMTLNLNEFIYLD
ncbi:DUF1549 domain-containing protein [Schlesneria paludicola]|uniref:DUF1549 domain-containing protein n=1 Tax=Schlesneria paludicola TaxID=360056 RepID=UPI00029A3C38|nr:DUF1549 domain-containing protein [Schlesneria paludicola]